LNDWFIIAFFVGISMKKSYQSGCTAKSAGSTADGDVSDQKEMAIHSS
jgi:hypothetical protein